MNFNRKIRYPQINAPPFATLIPEFQWYISIYGTNNKKYQKNIKIEQDFVEFRDIGT